MATKYNFIQEVENIWDNIIIPNQKSRNLGHFALCCQTYLLRGQSNSLKAHKKVLTINRFLRKYLITTKAKLIKYHWKTNPNMCPTLNLEQCKTIEAKSTFEALERVKTLKNRLKFEQSLLKTNLVGNYNIQNRKGFQTICFCCLKPVNPR